MTVDSFLSAVGGTATASLFDAWVLSSLKGVVLLLLAWVGARGLRRGSAAVRHLLWASALAGSLMVPFFARTVPELPVGGVADDMIRLLTSISWRATPTAVDSPESAPPRTTDGALPKNPPVTIEQRAAASMRELATPDAQSAPGRLPLGALLSVVWLLGATVLLLRALVGALQLSLWARRAHSVEDAAWLSLVQRLAHRMQISRPVTLLRSGRACVPMTWGVVYPTVLLPADADDWTAERRTIVLLHELAHIKRLDTLTQLLAQLSTALCWFNPMVWYAAAQMRREREHACDDIVLDAGARASDYAHDLLQIARPLVTADAPAAAALAMARRSELEGRLLAILDPRINRRPVSRLRLALSSVGIMGLAIPLAAVSPARKGSTPLTVTSGPVQTNESANLQGTAPQPVAPKPTVAKPMAPKPMAPKLATPKSPIPEATGPEPAIAESAIAEPAIREPAPATTLPLTKLPVVESIRASTPAPQMIRPGTKTQPDLETLIAVTQAAAKLTSDHDKAELLLTIAKHYVSNDELRTAYLDAVLSLTSDYQRSRTLEPVLLKDAFPASAVPQLVRIATKMTSDTDKSRLIIRVASMHPALSPSMRSGLISAMASMTSDYSRSRSIVAIAQRGGLSATDAIGLINAAKGMTSSYEKANALLAVAKSHPLDDREIRRAYFAAAETISSASDYRRAISRVLE